MKGYISKIEKFLRGQMSYEEESVFKKYIKKNVILRFQVSLLIMLIKNSKDLR
jgi:hypothetical protein